MMRHRDPDEVQPADIRNVPVPAELYRELERLSLLHERSVSDLIRHAVEIHYSDAAVSARYRLVDRLARLESELGDPETLQEQIAEDSRTVRMR
jgi:hypothetical protein